MEFAIDPDLERASDSLSWALALRIARMAPKPIFDRSRVAASRARAAGGFAAHDFLHRRAMADIVDRLESTRRSFGRALFYGAGGVEDLLTPGAKVGAAVFADLAPERLAPGRPGLLFDEERSPLAPASFDLIVSLLTLHAANDLVGALVQHRLALKPDGLFIAALFAEETLSRWRRALLAAESQATGGAAMRVAPFAGVKDLGQALQRAGFALPVADLDSVRVAYSSPERLLADLRGMGETALLAPRAPLLGRRVRDAAFAAFADGGGEERFDIVYLTGWAPHESQMRPLRPGSARASLEAAVRKFQ